MNEKPTKITVREFIHGGYAAKIANRQCKVLDGFAEPIEIKTMIAQPHFKSDDTYILWWVDDIDMGEQNWRDVALYEEFEVVWTDSDTTRPPAEGGEDAGASNDPIVLAYKAYCDEAKQNGIMPSDYSVWYQRYGNELLLKENAALRADNGRLARALGELDGAVEKFLDEYGDWSPKQRQMSVSSDAIHTLMNSFDKVSKARKGGE